MFRRDDCDLTQRWFRPYGAIGEHVGKLTEKPWAAQTGATNNDAGTTGLFHHQQRILSGPNIAVTKNRNIGNGFDERGDRIPMSATGIALLGGA